MEVQPPREKVTATIFCAVCKKSYQVKYFQKDYIDWKYNNAFIQQAFPYLTADERELLLTATCGPCFDEMFKEDDEDDTDTQISKVEKGTSHA